jgi:DNA-binding CsgD family transcriptional regulator
MATKPPERLRFEIQHLRANIEVWVRTPMAAYQIMVREADRAEHQDPADAAMFLAEAAIPCIMAGDIRLALAASRRAKSLADRAGVPTPLLINAVLAESLLLLGMAAEAGVLVDESMRRMLASPEEAAAVAPYFPTTLLAFERYPDARVLITGAVEAIRSASAVGLLPFVLAVLSELELRTGNLATAYAAGTESVRLAHETGQAGAASYGLITLARVEAAQGRDDECRAHAATAMKLAGEHGLGTIFNYAGGALGLLDLSIGRPAEAILHLERTAQSFRETGLREPNLIQWQPDYIESLARVGRTKEAVLALETLEEDGERTGRPWARATAARCRGFITQDTDHFRRALELHDASPSPFEVARTQLCYGETLRRQRHRVEARQVLREALNTFERLGAEPWATRAQNELAATGEKVRKRGVSGTRELTPQELQIALAVANGATNREAAAQLFLSPKTVEAHLSSAYRKLGARSRTELVRIFANETSPSMMAIEPTNT